MKIIIENPEITQVNIANRLGTAPKTVQRGIATLKTKGIIERVGSNKKGYWEIKKQNWKNEIALNLEISSRLIWYYKSVVINYNKVIDYYTSFYFIGNKH